MSEGNVFDLIKKLRRMHGHVGARDKAVLVEAIGALQDLSMQLYNATHAAPFVPPPRKTLDAVGGAGAKISMP